MIRTLVSAIPNLLGQTIRCNGWVDSIRDHGKLTFIDLRDCSGIVQLVGSKVLKQLHVEEVIEITGIVKPRSKKTQNPKLITGNIEIEVLSLTLLNSCSPLPFPIDGLGYDINQELRYQYRYLDLRRSRLQRNLKFRSKYVQLIREYLFANSFYEIETPLLTKSTPEGSRDFVVPSRLNPGKFFALPQSPQQYKQLLMTAGFEKYFQVAKCLRDEDPRSDRAYEHTQLDLEMSFVTDKDVMKLVEGMITYALDSLQINIAQKPFPTITYADAIIKHGADKFDLRTAAQKKAGVLAFCWVVKFPFFEKDEQNNWTFTHNPFSRPIPEHETWLTTKQHVGEILTTQYDLVCNGIEVGGGSLRSYQPQMLSAVFEIMGYSKPEINRKFGHMIKAFTLGTPPHGGCAHGFERLLMCIFNEPSIGDVQAFPQTSTGKTSVMDAPDYLSNNQLAELNLSINHPVYASIYDHIMALLNNHQVIYQKYQHPPCSTSEESANYRQTTVHQGAKALIIQTTDHPILFVLPADLRVDMKKLALALNQSRITLYPKDKVESLTKLPPGAIPPFGSTINLPTYVDSRMEDNDEIAFNAGSLTQSLKIKYSDFILLEKPTIIKI